MANFEILRNMDSFTEDMFNRIIGFQERDHAAWKPEPPFADKIKGLPLHYLMFSNADRNPATHGPTVAHFYPLRHEMYALAQYVKKVAPKAVVVDAHARNGFVGSLLAREGLRVIGMRDPADKPNQIEDFFDPQCYEVRSGTLANVDFPVDVIFSAWMPSGQDITGEIERIAPKVVIYIFTEHAEPGTDRRQTGSDGAFGEHLSARYNLIDQWSVTREENLLRDVWPDLTGSIAETRHIRVYADTPFHGTKVDRSIVPAKVYSWEEDLLMAETALAAKRDIQSRGFPVTGF